MKQLLFMAGLTLFGAVGSFSITPFCGVAVYHFFAVLRPQYLWKWSLPPGISWSYYVALAAIAATVLQMLGALPRPAEPEGPSARRFYSPHIWFALFFLWLGISYVMATQQDMVLANGKTLADVMEEYVKYFVMFWVTALVARSVRQVWALFILTGLAIGYVAYEVNFLYLASGYLGVRRDGYGVTTTTGPGSISPWASRSAFSSGKGRGAGGAGCSWRWCRASSTASW
jgi:hypothetical protein